MKKLLLFLCLAAFGLSAFTGSAYEFRSATDARGTPYRYIPGDPFAARFYTLSNGMKLYLVRNTREPRINTAIAVRAGSADDPLNSTGLAHYFEHMMFKGNDQIASLDWEKERPLLEKIESLFEEYRKESDPEKRAEIYKRIDELSGEAAQYSNDEFWTLCQSIGATGVNAYTSLDETVYICDIPSSNLEKFLYFNAVRFSSIALRRFHTELEAVYEEFNMQQDKDPALAWHRFLALLFHKHPYGRSVIGLPEHLKSPSMRDIRTFFQAFYRPENMALILSGDLNFEETAALAEKYFGALKPADEKEPVPFVDRKELVREEPPIGSERTADFAGPQAELLLMGYRFEASPETERMLDMISEILCNGKCGLIDKDILLPQKVLALSAGAVHARDYSLLVFKGTPRQGQSLEEVRDMVFAELEKLANGEFPDWLPRAAADNARLALVTISENRGTASSAFVDSFIRGYSFAEALNELDRMEKITKEQIMEFARKHLKKDTCAVVLKRTGPAVGLVHAEKPPITPVPIPDRPSAFAEKFAAMSPLPDPEPCFPDFEKGMESSGPEGRPGRDYRIRNTENERFWLSYVLPAGALHDLRLPLAFGLASYLGTKDLTLEQLQEELYRLAGSVSFRSDRFTSRITFSGLQRNYDKILDLFHGELPVLQADEEAWNAFRDSILKSRENAKKDPWSIFDHAYRYSWYGGLDSLANRYMPEEELKKLTADSLLDFLRSALRESGDMMDVVYYGPAESPRLPSRPSPGAETNSGKRWEQVVYQADPPDTDGVVFVDYPRVQTIAAVVRPDGIWKVKPFTFEEIYDEYARRNFWSDIRERRGLAYMAGAGYTNPTIMLGDWSSSSAYVQTQPDKLISCIDAMLAGLDRHTLDPDLFAVSKANILSEIRNSRIHPESYYDSMKDMERRGLTEFVGQTVYRELPKLSPEDFVSEWKKRISGKRSTIVIIGDAKKIDFEALKKYGPLTKLTLDQIFRK